MPNGWIQTINHFLVQMLKDFFQYNGFGLRNIYWCFYYSYLIFSVKQNFNFNSKDSFWPLRKARINKTPEDNKALVLQHLSGMAPFPGIQSLQRTYASGSFCPSVSRDGCVIVDIQKMHNAYVLCLWWYWQCCILCRWSRKVCIFFQFI